MRIKKFAKIITLSLVFVLTLSICSCTAFKSVIRDTPRIAQFTKEALEISKITDTEEMIARAEELIHPASGLTKESIVEKIKADEDLEGIDLEKAASDGYSMGSFSDPKLKFNDPELGGNVYEITVDVTIGGQVFKVTLDLLSDESTIGLYDFDIKK